MLSFRVKFVQKDGRTTVKQYAPLIFRATGAYKNDFKSIIVKIGKGSIFLLFFFFYHKIFYHFVYV